MDGREGGARPEPAGGVEFAAAPYDKDRGKEFGGVASDGVAGLPERSGATEGGVIEAANAGPLEGAWGPVGAAPLPELEALLCGAGPLGGGGVACVAVLALLGSFLLTHFFKLGS